MASARILIIEDDPALGRVFSKALQTNGYEVILDPDGNRYPALLNERPANLIFLDMHLPYASGVDILHVIRSNPRWSHIPVIILTADLNMANAMHGQANLTLVKPITVSRLQEVASTFVG
jgi:DNA-binding response OmpR family regulator